MFRGFITNEYNEFLTARRVIRNVQDDARRQSKDISSRLRELSHAQQNDASRGDAGRIPAESVTISESQTFPTFPTPPTSVNHKRSRTDNDDAVVDDKI